MGLRVNWRNIAGPILVASIIGISATSVRAATLFPLQTGADLQAVCATPKDVANISDEDKEFPMKTRSACRFAAPIFRDFSATTALCVNTWRSRPFVWDLKASVPKQ